MNAIFYFLIECTIILAVFYIIYAIFFAHDKDFKFSRFYLIISSLLAVLLPWMKIPVLPAGKAILVSPEYWQNAIHLPEIVVSAASKNIHGPGYWESPAFFLLLVYGSGIIFFLSKFLYQTGYILLFIFRNRDRIEKHNFYYLINTGGKIPTSSFFNYLFWDDTNKLERAEKNQVLRHEEGHIAGLHSLDIIYLETMRVLFWFNPFIHSYRKAISNIHEYQADDYVIRHDTGKHYLVLLARQVLGTANISLTNHFSKSRTLKRIKMIKSGKSRSVIFKYSVAFAASFVMFYAFSCETADLLDVTVDQPAIPAGWDKISGNELPDRLSAYPEMIRKNYPDAQMIILKTDLPSMDSGLDEAVDDSGWWVYVSSRNDHDKGNKNNMYAILVRSAETLKKEMDSKPMNEIHTSVDEVPSPVGGIKTFFDYVSVHLKYPESARENNIEGRVFVEFVVEKDGSISGVRAVRGIGTDCDQEAVRVIRNSPRWNPGYLGGRPVNVKMILPVTFNLVGKNPEAKN